MKISIVVHDLKGGGAEKMMVRLANGLAATADKVELVLLTNGGVNKSLVSANVSVVELYSHRTVLSLFRLRNYLSKTKPDRIISALTHVNVIAIIACLSIGMLKRLFVSERNAFSHDKKVNNSILIRIAYFVAPWLYHCLPNPLIAVSRGVASDLVRHTVMTERDVVWAPNPVLDDDFEETSYTRPSHPWLLDKKTPVIVAIGRLAHQKGFDLLIRAIAEVNDQHPCRLIIFGEGPLRTNLENLSVELGIAHLVSLPGYSPNVQSEVANSDLFVLSSRFEGSPNVLVEAMATGIPVIACNCPFGPSEILDDGNLAPLVPPEDAISLAREIENSLNTPNKEKEARLKKIKIYKISSSAAIYRAILENRYVFPKVEG